MLEEKTKLEIIQNRAPWNLRVLASVVDLVVIMLLYWILGKFCFYSLNLVITGSFILFKDVLFGKGQSVGKKLFDLRVIFIDENTPADISTSAFRNLLPGLCLIISGIIYFFTGVFVVGLIFKLIYWIFGIVFLVGIVWEIKCFLASGMGQRFGDLMAHTLVVRIVEK